MLPAFTTSFMHVNIRFSLLGRVLKKRGGRLPAFICAHRYKPFLRHARGALQTGPNVEITQPPTMISPATRGQRSGDIIMTP